MLKMYMSGRTLDPLNFSTSEIDIKDIAWNLSMLCRYTGSFPFHYSVAQHSLLVVDLMVHDKVPRDIQLAGLLHDAAEYLFGDMNFHLKKLPELAKYTELEHKASWIIVEHFGANPYHLIYGVKPYDRKAAAIEMDVRDSKSSFIAPAYQTAVYQEFLNRFHDLSDSLEKSI